MSNTKHRSLTRRINLLNKGSISLNCEGGMAMNDPDIQCLLRNGHMKFIRVSWKGYYNYEVRRSKATITESGKAFLLLHSALIDHRLKRTWKNHREANAYNIGRPIAERI